GPRFHSIWRFTRPQIDSDATPIAPHGIGEEQGRRDWGPGGARRWNPVTLLDSGSEGAAFDRAIGLTEYPAVRSFLIDGLEATSVRRSGRPSNAIWARSRLHQRASSETLNLPQQEDSQMATKNEVTAASGNIDNEKGRTGMVDIIHRI